MRELEPGTMRLNDFTEKMHHYKARVLKVIDSTTIRVDVDLGMRTKREEVIRLECVHAPDYKKVKSKEDQEKAEQAKGELYRLLDGKLIYIHTSRQYAKDFTATVWTRHNDIHRVVSGLCNHQRRIGHGCQIGDQALGDTDACSPLH